jgi:hypothetical protein
VRIGPQAKVAPHAHLVEFGTKERARKRLGGWLKRIDTGEWFPLRNAFKSPTPQQLSTGKAPEQSFLRRGFQEARKAANDILIATLREGSKARAVDMEEKLIAFLTADNAVGAIVGAKIYGGQADQAAAAPFIVVRSDSVKPEYHAGGESGAARGDFHIDLHATSYAKALDLRDLVRSKLSGNPAIDRLDCAFFADDRDLDQLAEFGRQLSEFVRRLTFEIHFWT